MPDYVTFKYQSGTPLKEIFTAVKDDLIDLLSSMLALNPLKRCTSSQALQMPYFSNIPAPTPSSQLPRPQLNSTLFDSDIYRRTAFKRNSSDKLAPMAKRLHFDNSDA